MWLVGWSLIKQSSADVKSPCSLKAGRGFYDKRNALDVEAEVDYVTILDDVFLTFQAPFSGFLGSAFTVVLNKVFVGGDLGADKAFLEVGMNRSCRLWRCRIKGNCPCSGFFLPSGEIVHQSYRIER